MKIFDGKNWENFDAVFAKSATINSYPNHCNEKKVKRTVTKIKKEIYQKCLNGSFKLLFIWEENTTEKEKDTIERNLIEDGFSCSYDDMFNGINIEWF